MMWIVTTGDRTNGVAVVRQSIAAARRRLRRHVALETAQQAVSYYAGKRRISEIFVRVARLHDVLLLEDVLLHWWHLMDGSVRL